LDDRIFEVETVRLEAGAVAVREPEALERSVFEGKDLTPVTGEGLG